MCRFNLAKPYFFDEIQACLPAISALRFFYEKYPELHVIAAGSLLECALADLPSFGVGRVRSIFVYPLSFDEFLQANGENLLLDAKKKAAPGRPLPEPIHQKLIGLFKRFLVLCFTRPAADRSLCISGTVKPKVAMLR